MNRYTVQTGSQEAESQDGLPVPRRHWAVLSMWLALIMAVLDSTVGTLALPAIAADLGVDALSAIWVVNAYQVGIIVALLPAGALGDILGYGRVYRGGLILFVIASILCALAPNLATLAGCRFLQGFGAAGIMSVNMALIRFTFPRHLLGRGIGYNALVIAVSSAAGPAFAAAILSMGSWRWLFLVNGPIGLLSVLIGWRAQPVTPRSDHPFDIRAALLNAVAFGGLFFGAEAFARGGQAWMGWSGMGVALVAAWRLVVRERGNRDPLMPVDLIRVPLLRLSYATSGLAFAAMMGGMVALPFYLEDRFGLDHVHIALMMSAMAVAIAIAAPLAGHLLERVSAAVLGAVGMAMHASGWLMMGLLAPDSGPAVMVAAMILCGAGFGLFQTPNNRTMIAHAPPSRSGAAAGMLAISRLGGQIGGALLDVLLFKLNGPATRLSMVCAAAIAVLAGLASLSRLWLVLPDAAAERSQPQDR